MKNGSVIVTTSGRPVARLPFLRFIDGVGGYLCLLSRIDVSDVGNEPKAEGFYRPILVIRHEDQMTTVEIALGKRTLVIFIAPRKVNWHVFKLDQETEW
jgi:hypothetical protein